MSDLAAMHQAGGKEGVNLPLPSVSVSFVASGHFNLCWFSNLSFLLNTAPQFTTHPTQNLKRVSNTVPVRALALEEAAVMENGHVYCGTIWGVEKRIHEEYKHQVEYYRSISFDNTY